ncbi:hypothetical protein ACHAW5_008097 [Stephanodiscus triporus]|uniref:Uncharacterized protein n=1 Tax=Stephanodiscus triporus TaxID=2934178 RepID=A0ABD3MHY9_9STRA
MTMPPPSSLLSSFDESAIIEDYYKSQNAASSLDALPATDGSGGHRDDIPVATFSLSRSLPSTSLLMKRLGRVLALSSTAIFLLVVFPLLLRSAINDARRGEADVAAFYSAASFVIVTLVLSVRSILSHLYNWYAPDVQKFVVRILFMVPLYSVQSWLGLRFHGPARVYIVLMRDLYEAYVIQSFVYYLIELLGGEERMADLLSRKDASLGCHPRLVSRAVPCLRRRWDMGTEFLHKIKHGVLQYVVTKTVVTLLTTFVFLPSGWYGEGTFSWDTAYVYATTILNVSVMYALYCLVKLFHAVKSDLRHPVDWHPVGKFLCVKGVIFFTFWQDVGIYFLRSHGFIGDVGNWSGDDVAGGIIDYLVCVEMVFFSIGHLFTFTYKEYLPEGMDCEDGKSGTSLIGWLFDGIDKRRRKRNLISNGSGGGDDRRSALRSALLSHRRDDGEEDEEDIEPCIDEDGNIAEESPTYRYRPPASSSLGFSKLEDPLSLREALWSSTVPRETLDDIKRLGVVSGGGLGQGHNGRVGLGYGGGPAINISLSSLNNAESI